MKDEGRSLSSFHPSSFILHPLILPEKVLKRFAIASLAALAIAAVTVGELRSQERPQGGPGGFGGGFGGPGGPMGEKQKLVKQFDKDGDGRLNKEERTAAREFLKKERAAGRGPRGF